MQVVQVACSRKYALGAVALLTLIGCTTQTQDDFTSSPPGPPASCTAIDALPGCGAGSVSYACAGDRPDDGDTNLVCDDGVPGPGEDGAATTLYCCAPYGQWASECVPATDVPGCGAESLGFSCSGAVTPDQVDTSIVCSGALAGDGGTHDYCCVPFEQSAATCRCSTFDVDAGLCGSTTAGPCGTEIGFDCAPGHTPVEVNPLLECPVSDAGAGAYCCKTP
jgi:hypothetical protein